MADLTSDGTFARISTGVAGLDAVLDGGLAPKRLYLVDGVAGSGKTTLALQFLLEGYSRGERCLYVCLSETVEEVAIVAASHGWTLDGIDLFDLALAESGLAPERAMTLLHPWEMDLGEIIKLVTDEVGRTGATCIVFDSLAEMRVLAQDQLRFRREILELKRFLASRGATVLMLDSVAGNTLDRDQLLHSLCHTVITLERLSLDFGIRLRLAVRKVRGATYRGGWHDYVIRRGGLEVFPHLVARPLPKSHSVPVEPPNRFVAEPVPSGLAELDLMMNGGPLRGTCTLLSGPPGSGRSMLTLQYLHAAATRGEHCAIYQFEEQVASVLLRSARLGLDLEPHIAAGRIFPRQIDAAEMAPGEFIQTLCLGVESNHTRVVVIDSVSGYYASMPEETRLVPRLHELLCYLSRRGVLTLLVGPQSGLAGDAQSPFNISYMADAIILLRFFEAKGLVRKALTVVKNGGGRHDNSIRELHIDDQGLRIGAVLSDFHGILTGTPTYTGSTVGLPEDGGRNA